ncbi:MAG: hypothetical protein QXQ57_01405 [Sulfolobales archaeon]
MGILRIKFGVYNPLQQEKILEVSGVVDTEAIHSVILRRILEGSRYKAYREKKVQGLRWICREILGRLV